MTRIDVLSDVGGVTFTFDKGLRKELWVREAGAYFEAVALAIKEQDKDKLREVSPPITENPYNSMGYGGVAMPFFAELSGFVHATQFGLNTNGIQLSNPNFREEAGKIVLGEMLIDPTATALLEYIQGEALKSGELTAQEVPGIRKLMGYVLSTGGVFQGYSTGAPKMPDQFHTVIGLDALVGNVKTTFPGHRAKERSAEQILKMAETLHTESGKVHDAFIDDNDNEAGIWLEARNELNKQGLGNPRVYLLKPDLDDRDTGKAQTSKGELVIVNSLDQIRETLAGDNRLLEMYSSGYTPKFDQRDNKFG
jgi:hypothetical protein